MKYLTLGDLWLALTDLLEKRRDTLLQSKIGKGYEDLFELRRKQFDAIPRELLTAIPLTEELAAGDVSHDDHLMVLLNTLQITLRNAKASKEAKEAAQEALARLQLSAADISASYPQEAATAKGREETIEALKDKLSLIQAPGGGTLYDTALDYLEAGRMLDALLSERSKIEALTEKDRSQIALLRNLLIGEVGRCRAAIFDEKKTNKALAENYDALLFGYFDDLHASRAASTQASKEAKEKPKEESSAKAKEEAKREAALAQVAAEELAAQALEAQKRAQEAKDKAEK
jgi:hypothetical protein